MSVVMDDDFVEAKTVTQDTRGRVAIGKGGTAKRYQMTRNAHGQILLTPVVEIPEYEMWLWQSPEALAALRRGLADEAAGRVHDLGSFAEFADAPVDD